MLPVGNFDSSTNRFYFFSLPASETTHKIHGISQGSISLKTLPNFTQAKPVCLKINSGSLAKHLGVSRITIIFHAVFSWLPCVDSLEAFVVKRINQIGRKQMAQKLNQSTIAHNHHQPQHLRNSQPHVVPHPQSSAAPFSVQHPPLTYTKASSQPTATPASPTETLASVISGLLKGGKRDDVLHLIKVNKDNKDLAKILFRMIDEKSEKLLMEIIADHFEADLKENGPWLHSELYRNIFLEFHGKHLNLALIFHENQLIHIVNQGEEIATQRIYTDCRVNFDRIASPRIKEFYARLNKDNRMSSSPLNYMLIGLYFLIAVEQSMIDIINPRKENFSVETESQKCARWLKDFNIGRTANFAMANSNVVSQTNKLYKELMNTVLGVV